MDDLERLHELELGLERFVKILESNLPRVMENLADTRERIAYKIITGREAP